MPPTSQIAASKPRALRIGIILAFALPNPFPAAAQPAGLARQVAAKEAETAAARAHYTYRQEVTVEEVDYKGGVYQEAREVIFSPQGGRSEQFVGTPMNHLKRLKLTEEDFHDIRNLQPFLLTLDTLWLYQTRPRGEETVDGIACWVLEVKPKQVLDGQRLFEGLLWIEKESLGVVKSEGVAVPQILSRNKENLFPRFTTFREKVDGKFWFPVHTHADDRLPFSTGALRMRMNIRYRDYKRFGAESTIKFGEPKP
jgi:hypothetical protein